MPQNQGKTFFSIITKYIYQLITKLLQIKAIKQDNTGHKIYIRHIPLNVNSVHKLNIDQWESMGFRKL